MEYVSSNIVDDFFKNNPDFSKYYNHEKHPIAISIGDLIYISCFIKTNTKFDYTVIYEPGYNGNLLKSKEQAFKEDDYWSAFNKGFFAKKTDTPNIVTYCNENDNPDIIHTGIGAALAILDKSTLSIQKIFYFKDTYNMDFGLDILDETEGKLVVSYSEYNYVFEKEQFTFLTFGYSYRYLKLDYLWIAYPYYGYDESCFWHLINFKENVEHPIYALTELLNEYPSIQDYTSCWYDFEKCIFIFGTETESVSMDYITITAKENHKHQFQYKNIGSKNGICKLLSI